VKPPPPPPKKKQKTPPPPPPSRGRRQAAAVLGSAAGESLLEAGKRRMGLKVPPPPAPPRRAVKAPPKPPRKPAPKPKPRRAKLKPKVERRPTSPPDRKPEPQATIEAITEDPWPSACCVWCKRPITDEHGNASPGYKGWPKPQAIPSFWRSQTGALFQGFACKVPCKRNWEGGWGTAYRGTPAGERCERNWKKPAKRVKETEVAYPQFDEAYRKRSFT